MSGADCSTFGRFLYEPLLGSCKLQSQSVGAEVCWHVGLCTRNGERDELTPENGPQEWAKKALEVADGLLS